jgi:hypothetical protein
VNRTYDVAVSDTRSAHTRRVPESCVVAVADKDSFTWFFNDWDGKQISTMAVLWRVEGHRGEAVAATLIPWLCVGSRGTPYCVAGTQ